MSAHAVEAGGCAPPVIVDEAVDVLAVLDAVTAVVTSRVHRYNKKANDAVRAGKEPHPDCILQQERAAYLADHYAEARAAVVELVEASRALKEAMDMPERGPFDTLTVNAFHSADARFCAALARIGGAA